MHSEQIIIKPGADTAALMIHGIVETPCHFRDLLPVIPESWSVYNLLLDGHGGSVEDFARTSMEKWKAQVNRCLDELLENHQRVLIIGHSMGTLFAIQSAIDRPDRIPALFLLACPVRVHYPPKTMSLCIRTVLGKTDPAATQLRNDSSVALSPRLWKYITWIPRFWELLRECRRVRRMLPLLRTPTLCFQIRRDELVSLRGCKDIGKNPSVILEILEESGHFGYTPDDMNRLKQALEEWIHMYF